MLLKKKKGKKRKKERKKERKQANTDHYIPQFLIVKQNKKKKKKKKKKKTKKKTNESLALCTILLLNLTFFIAKLLTRVLSSPHFLFSWGRGRKSCMGVGPGGPSQSKLK
jgi:hypothetical protein